MKNKYSLSEVVSTVYALVLTKIAYKGARLIRRPVYMRGRKGLRYGGGLTTGHGCRFDLLPNPDTLCIGNRCEMGDYTHIVAHEKVLIGDNVLMASKVFISDTNHGWYRGDNQTSPYSPPNSRKLVTNPVMIGDNVWIGENVVILPGTRIGNGCIIGANAVVSGIYDDNLMIAGVPAKIIKKWDVEKQEWENA